MKIYEKKLRIELEHVSVTKKLRPSALLKLFQEIAIEHSDVNGGLNSMGKNLIWVVADYHAEALRMPEYLEEITLRTWCSKPKHIIFPRNYEISDKSGNVIVRSAAQWLLIDAKERKLAEIETGEKMIETAETGREIQALKKIRMPKETTSISKKAEYSFVDINGHINNTVYPDICENQIPIDFLKNTEMKTLDIEYRKEILLGEDFILKYGNSENSWYFSGGENPNFTLKIEYK